MADTVNAMADVTLYAVASRSLERAQKFADTYGAKVAYGSYEELAADENVDLIYVATPHSHHFEHMKLCIEHGKAVLCEKAFTKNAKEAREITELAREKKVLIAEAIWTRYMPSRQMINKVLEEKPVGEISVATCNLSYDIDHVERIVEPELCGGALLDIGVYGLNFLTMHLGKNVEKIDSSVIMTEKGIDCMENITMRIDGKMGCTNHSIYARSDRKGIFQCEKGYIVVENINNPQSIHIFDDEDRLIKKIEVPAQISGYEYEVAECFDCLEKGLIECPSMPLDESIYMMEMMDRIRDSWGMKYPGEE